MIFSLTGRILCILPSVCLLPLVCGSQTAFYTSTLVKFVKAHLILILEDNSTFVWRFGTDLIIYAVLFIKIGRAHKGFGQSHGRDKFSCTFINRNLPKRDTYQFKHTLKIKHGLSHIQTLIPDN